MVGLAVATCAVRARWLLRRWPKPDPVVGAPLLSLEHAAAGVDGCRVEGALAVVIVLYSSNSAHCNTPQAKCDVGRT